MSNQPYERPPVKSDRTDELLLALDGVVQRLRYLAADPNMPAARLRRELLLVAYTAEADAVPCDHDADTAVIPDDEMVDLSVRPDGTPF
jgi:hypothetical protein